MRKILSLLVSSALLATSLTSLSLPSASADTTLTTCTNLETGKTLVLRSTEAECRSHLGSALWVQEQSDTASRTGAGYASITICSSKNPLSTYRFIKDSCPNFQVSTNYWRTVAPPATPIIQTASARGHDSAALFITPATSAASAPVLYYLVTDMKSGLTSKVRPGNFGHLYLSGLSAESTYIFTIAAVSVDGTSVTSLATPSIKTATAPVVASNTSIVLAAPAFTLSSSSETKTVNNVITGYTITSSGGAIASYAITPAAPAGLTFSTSTGLLSGTPTSSASATAYTITATNASGSATRTFTLTVTAALAAPAFTLSSSSETKTVNTAATGFTINSTGGVIASFAISATPAGMSFSTSTGALTGTPTSIASATAYTITATNASGTATQTFTLTVTTLVYAVGDTGPGGGKIFYVATTPFACGPTRATTCTYLEAAPTSGTNAWTDAAYVWSGNTSFAIGATAQGTAIGTGFSNTIAIVDQAGGGSNAGKAGTASRGYGGPNNLNDWFLPSKDELNQMCKWQRGITGTDLTTLTTVCVGGTLNSGVGAVGFVVSGYWSSSETNANSAWFQDFNGGAQYGDYKVSPNYVRPVRAF